MHENCILVLFYASSSKYTLQYTYIYIQYTYIDIHRIQYTDSMVPSFTMHARILPCMRSFYHACARIHTSVYFRPILLLHVYKLHSYTTKYTLHYVYSIPASPGCDHSNAQTIQRIRAYARKPRSSWHRRMPAFSFGR